MRLSFYVYLILAIVGVYMSEILIDLHVNVNYAGGGDDATCAAGSSFSCAAVLKSELASLFGLPIAVLGLAFYIAVAIMVPVERFASKVVSGLPDVFFVGALLATLYSIFLLIGSKVVVGKFCIRCMGLYAVNLCLLITAWRAHPEGGLTTFKRLPKLFLQPGLWATVLVLAIATPSVQYLYAKQVDSTVAEQIQKKRAEQATAKKETKVDVGKSPMRGNKDAQVTIVEFADFQCGFCQEMAFSLKGALKKMPNAFKYHFKNFPLRPCPSNSGEVHRSCAAAIALNCAKTQGKPWEMHDLLFANQQALADDNLLDYANRIGIDVEVFRSCLKHPDAHKSLSEDVDQGHRLQIESTPTWYINGLKQVGPLDTEVIISMVKNAQFKVDQTAAAEKAKTKPEQPTEDKAPKEQAEKKPQGTPIPGTR